MKKLLVLGFALMLLNACKNEKQRYFSESAEINTFRTSISDYNKADWTAWSAHFADTIKFYVNSTKGVSINEFKQSQMDLLINFSSYSFLNKDSFMEMVVDSDEETWINYWATWRGTLDANQKEIDIPVHITSQFIDGKMVKLYSYWDSAPITAALHEIATERIAAEVEQQE